MLFRSLGADRVLDFLIKLAKILQQGLQFPQHGWGEDCPTKPTSTTRHEARSSTVRGKDESEEVGSTVPLLTVYWWLNLLFICSDTDKREIYKMYLCSQKIGKAIPKQIMRHRVEESQYCLPALRRPTVSLRSHPLRHPHELGSYARRAQRWPVSAKVRHEWRQRAWSLRERNGQHVFIFFFHAATCPPVFSKTVRISY